MTRRFENAQIAPARAPRRWRVGFKLFGLVAFCGLSTAVGGVSGAPGALGEGTVGTVNLGGGAAMATMLSEERVLAWPMEHVWPTAVRYLRVDRGYSIADKDPESGFILFDFPLGSPGSGSDRTGRGSLELFATTDASGRASVHVKVGTDSGPVHLPHAILEGLAEKLRSERGQAPAPPPKKPEPDKPGPKPKQPGQKPGQKPGEEPPAEEPPEQDPDGDDLTLE